MSNAQLTRVIASAIVAAMAATPAAKPKAATRKRTTKAAKAVKVAAAPVRTTAEAATRELPASFAIAQVYRDHGLAQQAPCPFCGDKGKTSAFDGVDPHPVRPGVARIVFAECRHRININMDLSA